MLCPFQIVWLSSSARIWAKKLIVGIFGVVLEKKYGEDRKSFTPIVCSLDEVEYMPPTPAVDVGAAGGVEPAGLRSGEVDDAPAGGGVLVGIAVEVGEMKVKWVMPGLELAELESDDPFARALAPPSPLPPPPSAPTRRPLVTHAPTTSRPTTASTSNSAATMACTASKPYQYASRSLSDQYPHSGGPTSRVFADFNPTSRHG
ncbi:hypothetical protein B0H14DRAFT_2635221 [Mycena olivaceomarginata]|nr:hypothetical protein B0H14DRAFT_2635221 [Mycena olivaceomarginata]